MFFFYYYEQIKTTSPEKFRVRPSTGVLAPGATTSINVVLQQGQLLATLNKDKFLVMCMELSSDASTSLQDITELWKVYVMRWREEKYVEAIIICPFRIPRAIVPVLSNID